MSHVTMEIGFRVMLKWYCIIIPEALTTKCYTRYPTPPHPHPHPTSELWPQMINYILCIEFALDYSILFC